MEWWCVGGGGGGGGGGGDRSPFKILTRDLSYFNDITALERS